MVCRMQHCVTLSATESKNVALSDVARKVSFLRELLELFRTGRQRGAVEVYVDNDGAVKLVSNPFCTNRTKHIDVQRYFQSERLKVIKVTLISSVNQSADSLLTKNLHEDSSETP